MGILSYRLNRKKFFFGLLALGVLAQMSTAFDMQSGDEMLGLYVQSGPFLKLEEGEMSPEDFCSEVRRRIPGGGADVTDAQVHDALNAFLIGIPEHRLVELRMLRKDFGIYLLSNTNPIMYYSKIARLGLARCDSKEVTRPSK